MRSQQLTALIRLATSEIRRTHLPWLVVGAVGLCLLSAEFAAGLAVTESAEYRIVIYSAAVRVLLVMLLGLAVIANTVRESDDRLVELLLSRPVPRSTWYLAKFCGYALAAIPIAIAAALPIVILNRGWAALAWSGSLACELSIVVAAALTAAVGLAQVPAAFAVLCGFYFLARAIAEVVLLSTVSIVDLTTPTNRVIAALVNGLSYLVPDLGRFTSSSWLIYEPPSLPTLEFIVGQTALYCSLLVAVGLVDFHRRNL